MEQTWPAQSDNMALMTTNLVMSAEAKAESDQRWAQWIATGSKRNRARQERVTKVAIVIAIAFAIWLAKLLVLG
jgi:tellurite resistance protein